MSNLVATNDVLEENELDRIHKFNDRIGHLFLYTVCQKSSLA